MNEYISLTGIGQDSHKFSTDNKPLTLGGVTFTNEQGLLGNSDADVILHAICNAISSISGVVFLGPETDKLVQQGITDSKVYVQKALKQIQSYTINHVAISIEAKVPAINPKIPSITQSIADLLHIPITNIGITATTGEELSAFGCGKGIAATVILSVQKPISF